MLSNCELVNDSYPYLITHPNPVNARRCAGATCEWAMELDSGQTIAVLNTLNSCPVAGDPRWLKVLVEDELLYLHASLAEPVDQEATFIQLPAPPESDSHPGPISLPSPDAQESTTHYVLYCSGVNVRACADTSCEIVVSLPFRSAVPVIGEAQGEEINGDTCWKEIWYEGESAYIHCSLLTETQPSARQDQFPLPKPASLSPASPVKKFMIAMAKPISPANTPPIPLGGIEMTTASPASDNSPGLTAIHRGAPATRASVPHFC